MNFKVRKGLFISQRSLFNRVLISTGIINSDLTEGDIEGSGLGCGACGVIRRVEPDVRDLSRVIESQPLPAVPSLLP